VLPPLKYRGLINDRQKFVVSRSVGLRSMKMTLTSAWTAHRARETVEMLRRETSIFISPMQWPPNSPDLKLVNYAIWGKVQLCASTARESVMSTTSLSDSCRIDSYLTMIIVELHRVHEKTPQL